MFLSLGFTLERMKVEGVVDMFFAVKLLRTQRSFLVQTEVCETNLFGVIKQKIKLYLKLLLLLLLL